MGSSKIVLWVLALALPGPSHPQRQRVSEHDVRGSSYGLENFLTQPVGLEEITETADIRRVRPGSPRTKKHGERGQTYGLESLTPKLYALESLDPPKHLGPVTFDGPLDPYEAPVSVVSTRTQNLDETKRKPLRRPLEKPAEFMITTEAGVEETSTRTRKRVMRRRKKKPAVAPSEETPTEPPQTFPEATSAAPVEAAPNKDAKRRKRPIGFRRIPESTTEVTSEAPEPERQQEETEAPLPRPTERFVPSKHTEVDSNKEVSSTDLKTLLKQQGTLSLSEILQTQNLSLADFLKGNRGAISALGKQQTSEDEEEKPEPRKDQIKKIPRISVNSRPFSKPIAEGKQEEPPKTLDIAEVTEDRPSYNGFAPKNPRTRPQEPSEALKNIIRTLGGKPKEESVDVVKVRPTSPVTEAQPTTEEDTDTTLTEPKLVVPKRYGDLRQKLRIDRRKWNSTTTAITTERSERTTIGETFTSATKIPELVEERPKPKVRVPFMSANNPDVSVIIQNKTTSPPKERLGLNARDRLKLFNKRVHGKKESEEKDDSLENTIQVEKSTTTTTEEPYVSEESIEVEKVTKNCDHEPKHDPEPKKENKDEIIELLKSGNNVQRLQMILAERNMTLEELLENREQGSAQRNKTERPKPKEERQEKKIRDENEIKVFQSFPDFTSDNRIAVNPTQWSKRKDSLEEPLAEESVVSSVRVRPTLDRVPHLNLSPGNPNMRTPLPGWNVDEKSIYASNPYGYPSYDTRQVQNTRVIPEVKVMETTQLEENDIILLETIKKSQEANRKLKSNINDILQEQAEVKESEGTEKAHYIPPAVRSAIIASGVVLGIALFVFVAIFAACGWKQRQIRLKARTSILNDTLTRHPDKKAIKRSNTMSPISFKQSSLYKKSLDFDETASTGSGSSNASSYLWNTLKNTFTSRSNTLKNHREKEEKEREEQILRNTLKREEARKSIMSREERINTLQRQESRRQEERLFNTLQTHDHRFNSLQRGEERGTFKKLDPERSVIKTSVNFKRGGLNSSNHFNSCGHLN